MLSFWHVKTLYLLIDVLIFYSNALALISSHMLSFRHVKTLYLLIDVLFFYSNALCGMCLIGRVLIKKMSVILKKYQQLYHHKLPFSLPKNYPFLYLWESINQSINQSTLLSYVSLSTNKLWHRLMNRNKVCLLY